eukprot:m51a1_g8493 hypothetical protein (343) ;mRNA; f:22712-27066
MSTRTERIFAAFQGPVLSVGTAVVHMFRSYTAELLLPRRWRLALGLSTEGVLAALQKAAVRADASALSPPLRCELCGEVLTVSDPRVFVDSLPGDLESFCATLRSHCTSSRRHLRVSGGLVLTVDVGDALMSTRTERIFAAFQGPVLSVGTAVVYMFRSYTAELLLPRRWRLALGLCAGDVMEALQHATVRVDASLSSPPLRCASCGDVVVLSMVRMCPDGLPEYLESYCATMRSNCSSSRRHLRSSSVALAVEVGGVLVCSERFSVYARKPGRQQKRKTASTTSAIPSAPNLAIVVRVYRTAEDAESGSDVCAKYRRNAIPNAVNSDFEGLWQLVARVRNW